MILNDFYREEGAILITEKHLIVYSMTLEKSLTCLKLESDISTFKMITYEKSNKGAI